MENPALVPVRVLLRLRPIQRHHVATVNSPATVTLQTAQSPRTFTFDSVYDSDADQETVWEGVQSAVDGVLEGVNGTILAYGQTSSGKTYTMGSDHTCDVPENIRGIIPRAVEKIFAGVEEAHSDDPDIKYVVKLSFLEIYQEQIRDLLMPSSDPKDLSIRKDRHGVTVVSGLSERVVNSAEECLNCLEMGAIERTTGDTQMHMNSSRSHAIFMLVVEQHQVGDEPCILRVSKLCLVDLAGSERLKRTRAEGIRFKESVKINSGLLALGNVISILGDSNSSKDRHVPYRESKLTRLLQDSLGGNAKTVMIACISPAEEDTEETLNTLKYADRARKIQNKPVVNIVNHHAVQLASMLDQIHVLEDRLKNEKDGRPRASSDEEEEHDDEGVGGEDREWVHGFMLELKARTAKGAKALKELEVVTRERDLLRNEMIALEQHLQDSNNQTSQAFADMDRLSSEHSQLSVKLMEAETRIQVLENEKADLVRDAGVLVDAVVGWMSGGEMTVAENIKGVVKRWRPDSGICLDRSGPGAIVPNGQHQSQNLNETPDSSRPPSAGSEPQRKNQYRRRRVQRNISNPDMSHAALLDRQHAAIRRLEDELFDSENEVGKLKGKVEEKEAIVARLERVNSEVITENDSLRAEVQRLQDDQADMLAEIHQLRLEQQHGMLQMLAPAAEHHLITNIQHGEIHGPRIVELVQEESIQHDEGQSILNVSGIAEGVDEDRTIMIEASSDSPARHRARRPPPVANNPAELLEQLWRENERLTIELNARYAMVGDDDQFSKLALQGDSGSQSDEDNRTQVGEEETDEIQEIAQAQSEEGQDADSFPVHVSEVRFSGSRAKPLPPSASSEQIQRQERNAVSDVSTREDEEEVFPEQLVRDLEAANRARVEVAKDLSKAHKETERLRHTHTEKIHKLERELESARDESTKCAAELLEAHTQRDRMRDEHERRIKSLESQIQKFKSKQRDWEKVGKEKDLSTRKAMEYKDEIAKLSEKTATLKKRLKEESEKAAEHDSRRAKELAAVKKQTEEDARKIRHLEQQIELMRKKLDRKAEEMASLKGKRESVGGRGRSVGNLTERKGKDRDAPTLQSLPDTTHERVASAEPIEAAVDHMLKVEQVVRERAVEMENFKLYHSLSKQLRDVRLAISNLTRELDEGNMILNELDSNDEMRAPVAQRVKELDSERHVLQQQMAEIKIERDRAEASMTAAQKGSTESSAIPSDLDVGMFNALAQEVASSPGLVKMCNQLKSASNISEVRNLAIGCIQQLAQVQNKDEPVTATTAVQTETDSSAETTASSADASHINDLNTLRKANKDLRVKLKEVVTVNHKLAAALEKDRKEKRMANGRDREQSTSLGTALGGGSHTTVSV